MPSDEYSPCPFQLAAIHWLAQNDYSDIKVMGDQLLTALDGKRQVLIWLDSERRVPSVVVGNAHSVGARIDVITLVDEKMVIHMNLDVS